MIAVAGVVVGALLAALASWWGDRRRWCREDELRTLERLRERELRWIDVRRQAYVGYLRAARISIHAVRASALTLSIAEVTSGDVSRQAGYRSFDSYSSARDEMQMLLAEIDLVGPSNMASIASDLLESIDRLADGWFKAGHEGARPEAEIEVTERFLEEFQRGARFTLRTDHEIPPRTPNLS